jgi:short-subunit dehydrogenase involved in D-alanine esterification of teichoic acids
MKGLKDKRVLITGGASGIGVEPRLFVEIKRVDQNAVMIEYREKIVRIGRHVEVLRC